MQAIKKKETSPKHAFFPVLQEPKHTKVTLTLLVIISIPICSDNRRRLLRAKDPSLTKAATIFL